MKKEKKSPEENSLQQKADAKIVKLQSGKVKPSGRRPSQSTSEAEMQKLIHELQVNRIELEKQNDELQQAIEKAAIAIALYDFAPNGYFTIRPDGTISQLNLSGAKMLGEKRLPLRNSDLNQFITSDTKPAFTEFLQNCFETCLKQTCEIGLAIQGKPLSFLYLEGIVTEDNHHCLVVAVDITERKQKEEALRESEKMYRLLIRNLPETTVFLFDYDLRFILAEGSFNPGFGFTTEFIEGKTLWEVLPEENASRLAPNYINALRGIPTENYISKYKSHSYSVNILPVRNNQGDIIAGMVVSQDITERKRMEKLLQANYSLLRIAGEAAKFGGWSIDVANNKVIWSDEVAAIHEMPAGYSPLLEEGINFYAPEWRYKITQAVTDCAENGIPFDEEMELITSKSNRIWVRVIGEAVRNENGKIVKVQGAFQDINARKLAQEEILKSNRQYDNLVSKIPVGVYILKTKPDGTFALEYASPRMAEMLGLSVERLLAHHEAIYAAIHPEDLDSFIKLNHEGILHKVPFDWKGRVVIKGDVRWLQISSTPEQLDNMDILWHGLIVDITDRVRDEAEIKLKNETLIHLNATKDKFFSIIAHDLKSPFNSIIGFSGLLARQIQERDYAAIGKYAEIIQNSSQQAMDLLMNLLEWSRSQTGRIVFTPEIINISALINEATELLYVLAEQKSIAIYTEMPDRLSIIADKAMVGTILRNLISNALKFTHEDGKIVISTEQKTNELVVSVQDDGVGMNEDAISKLFRIEENHSTLGTQKEKGTGLGLLLCKEFVDKHGGRICVESKPGKGSKFFFTIPNIVKPTL